MRGQTDLLDAVTLIADSLMAESGKRGTVANKIIVLVTDGDHRMELIGTIQPTETDAERRKREKVLLKQLKDNGIKVYAVALTRELDTSTFFGPSARLRAEELLRKLTKETGGRVVFPTSKDIDTGKFLTNLLGQ